MAGKHYIGEIVTDIIIDCGSVVTGATGITLKVKKPDDTEVEWDADIEGTNYLKHTTESGDFDQAGTYFLQASLTLSGWIGLGETALFVINAPFVYQRTS